MHLSTFTLENVIYSDHILRKLQVADNFAFDKYVIPQLQLHAILMGVVLSTTFLDSSVVEDQSQLLFLLDTMSRPLYVKAPL